MLLQRARGEGAGPMVQLSVGGENARITTTSRKTRDFYQDPLLPYLLQCIHPGLRGAVEVQDRAALLRGAQLLVEHGTPDEVARRIAVGVREGDPKGEDPSVQETGDFGADILLEPAFVSPSSEFASFYDADEELQRRCHHFLLTFTGAQEAYNVPYDVQRRVVPVLYAWVVNWEFLRRNTECWGSVAECFCRVVRSRRRRFSLRPDFELPWRPLVEILMSLFFQFGVMDLNVFQVMRKIAGRHLEELCELAALHFGADAWPGLWETFAPYFCEDREEAPMTLCLLCHLFPVHQLADDATGAALPLTERIVKFLLDDALYWQQRSGNWLAYSLKILFKMSLHHVGVVDFDSYAEPLFSAMLYELHLPIAEGMAMPEKAAGFGVLSQISLFSIGENEMAMAEGCVGNMLPRRTDSPLWNHLQRFIHATSVFLRPNATDKAVLRRVFAFYSSLVAVVHRRMKRQRSYTRARTTHPTQCAGRRIPEAYLWNRDTIDRFVGLVAPVLRLALHHRLEDVARIVGLLASLSPPTVQQLVLPCVDAGIRDHVGSSAQRALALRLLTKSLFPLSECRATRDECWLFLADALPLLLQWVSPGELSLSRLVLNLVFLICSMTKLRDLLGGQDAECSFAVALVERLFACAPHVKFGKGCDFDVLIHAMNALSLNMSDETLSCCISRVCREADAQGCLSNAHAVSCLLEPIARRAPERMMRWAIQRFAPPLQNASTSHCEVQWCAHLLAGCIRGAGLAGFSHRHELLRCIQCQVSFITSKERLLTAAALYTAVFAAFTEKVCTEAKAEEAPVSSTDDWAAQDAEEVDADSNQDAFEVSMCFCRSSTVQMTWREPTEAHLAYVVDVYSLFIEDIVDTVHNIERVLPPAAAARGDGLKSLLHLPTDDASQAASHEGAGSAPAAATPTAAPLEANSDAFTPKNVLRGVILWLRLVLEINQECHGSAGANGNSNKKSNMVPWWVQDPKCTLPLLPPALVSPALMLVPERIHRLLMEHTLRRMAGNMAEEIVIAKALHLDRSPVTHGMPPLDPTQANGVDPRGLHLVLTVLAELCNITPVAPLQYDHCRIYTQGPELFGSSVVEPLKERRYLPALFWRMKAESYTYKRRLLLLHTVSPKRLTELLSVAHTFLFSPYLSIQGNCSQILSECIPMMSCAATRRFLSQHLSVLEHIAKLWAEQDDAVCQLPPRPGAVATATTTPTTTTSSSSKVDTGGADAESPAGGQAEGRANSPASSAEDNTHRRGGASGAVGDEDEYNDADAFAGIDEGDDYNGDYMNELRTHCLSHLRRILTSALPLASTGFGSSCFCNDEALIYRTYEVLLHLPDQLVVQRGNSRVMPRKPHEFGGLATMEGATVARLCDKLLLLALQFAHRAPDRTVDCLLKIVTLYRPSQIALLSPQSVPIIFRLSVNSHGKARATSLHILQTLVLSLREPHPKAYVLTRRGALETSENVGFFRARYEVLKRDCPSFYGLRDVGLAFVPKAIRVDAEDVSPDMFHDGEAATVPAATVEFRKTYTERGKDDTTNPAQAGLKQQQERLAREELKRVIGHLSGILDTELNPPTADEPGLEGAAAAKLREGWIWKVMQLRHEQKTFSECRMRVWKAIGKLLGVEPSVRLFTRLSRLWLSDFVTLARGGGATAKESPQWLFSCVFDLLVAAIRMSKRHPAVRQEVLTCYIDALRLVCTSILVPHGVLVSFLQSVAALGEALKVDEVWSIYEFLFAALMPSPPSAAAATDPPSTEEDTDTVAQCSTSCCSGRTQELQRVLSVMVHLLGVFAHEVNVELLPRLCEQVLRNKEVFLYSLSSCIQGWAACVISEIMCLSLCKSEYIPPNVNAVGELLRFVDRIERLVELPPPPQPEPQPTLAPWSETPALGAAPLPLVSKFAATVGPPPECPMDPSLPLVEGFSLDSGRCTMPAAKLATVKTFVACWARATPPLLALRAQPVLSVLVRALDIAMPEMDGLTFQVESALQSIACVRLPKGTIQDMLQMLCSILKEERPYGKSRQAKVALSRMLCRVLLNNLHRIGKFAAMQNVAAAALASIGHGDGRVRSEGRLLLAVLSRVASVEQIEQIIRGYFQELRALSPVAASMAGAHPQSPLTHHENLRRRRRIALLLALCSLLSATPGVVPPYVPRLVERLAAYASDPAPEVQRAVRLAFDDWWRSHREGWELEHRPRFAAAGVHIEGMLPLLTAPAYLV
ncbi:uncharacterized protein Tco025E_06583 [Trypanosoma conorhini]|uniref:Proteasome activator complex subunit 4 C-terminal domain-containing protein n=1 Tax=Trypanosoma conorhini TaxID=83891 RepID=A0A3S5ISJ8_9TRYP|nr:uncharacterized protein Tco025E_06583 [Trypanosoma conorhini]RNF11707.1 hypothetical protein Tco025E_06583 [Trypanosoma conorhini]